MKHRHWATLLRWAVPLMLVPAAMPIVIQSVPHASGGEPTPTRIIRPLHIGIGFRGSRRHAPPLTLKDASWQHPCGLRAKPLPTRHVIMLWFENQNPRRALHGVPANELAGRCGYAEEYYGLTHPSLPNYLAAVSGSTHGVQKNCWTCQLSPAGLLDQVSWKLYAEGMPENCDPHDALPYAAHHNFGIHFMAAGCASRDQPLAALWSDLTERSLPAFSFILPDDCHSMHTNRQPPCAHNTTWRRAVTAGNAWMAVTLSRILASSTYRAGHTVILIAWDEGEPVTNRGENCIQTHAKDCHTMLIAVSPSTRPGSRTDAFLTPYSLLRTSEHLLGVPVLGGGQTARGFWRVFNL